MKYTGIVRSAEEITGQKECKEFKGNNFVYTKEMNDLTGKRIELWEFIRHHIHVTGDYDFFGGGHSWQKGWLKDIQEVKEPIDWSKVKVDTKVLVWNKPSSEKCRRYFAKFKDGSVYCWDLGTTAWSSVSTARWDNAELAEEYEGSL